MFRNIFFSIYFNRKFLKNSKIQIRPKLRQNFFSKYFVTIFFPKISKFFFLNVFSKIVKKKNFIYFNPEFKKKFKNSTSSKTFRHNFFSKYFFSIVFQKCFSKFFFSIFFQKSCSKLFLTCFFQNSLKKFAFEIFVIQSFFSNVLFSRLYRLIFFNLIVHQSIKSNLARIEFRNDARYDITNNNHRNVTRIFQHINGNACTNGRRGRGR